MWVRALFISLILVLFLIGCGGDDGVAPDPPPQETPIVSGTIGPEGGELRSDEVILTIPAGALTEDTQLKIFEESDTAPFGQEGLPVYAIEGLPEDLGAAVGLRFQHGVTGQEGVSLFLGELREARSVGRELFWELSASRDSSGWCLAQLTRGPIDFGDKADVKMRAAIIEGLVSTTPSAHFQVHYLESNFDATRAAWSLNMLEEAYDHLYDLGFHFGDQDTIWPVDAYMVSPESHIAVFVCGHHGKGFFRLPPHSGEPNNLFKSIYMHEVFHLAQKWYDTRPSKEWIQLNNERLWFDEATASWSENYFYPYFGRPGSLSLDNYWAPLAGVAGHPTLRPPQYGYGMSSFIEAMVDVQGVEAVNDLYVQFVLHDQDSVEALQTVLDPPLTDWCLPFQQGLVQGTIFNLDGIDLIGGFFEIALIPRDVGEFSDFNLRVRDFGSAGKIIELAHANGESEADALRIQVTGGVKMSVWRTNLVNPPNQISTGVGSLTIGGLDVIHEADEYLLVLATKDWSNDPGWTSHLDVRVEVEMLPSETDVFQMQVADIRVGSAESYWNFEGDDCPDPGGPGTIFFTWEHKVGQWQGTTFTANWDDAWTNGDVDYQEDGSLSITMDSQGLNVIDWSCQNTRVRTQGSSVTTVTEADWTGGDIPLNDDPSAWMFRYTLGGAEIGGWVNVSWRTTYSDMECIATLVLGSWFDYSLMQVAFQESTNR